MQITFDTCFLLRIQEIDQILNLKLKELFADFIWVYSDELLLEYKRQQIEKFLPKDAIYIPLTKKEWNYYQSKYPLESFDLADQEIVILGLRDGITTVTGDRDLFHLIHALKLPVIQIWAFLLKLVDNKMLSKNNMAKIINYWVKSHQYSKGTIKLMKNILQKIS
ncbi:MAG: hypothetical protein K9W44_13540 [Candidatus Lokiarchaeota archaeon]|nr:hypothetical protein [Candidatus Harpocratesius repetitus]